MEKVNTKRNTLSAAITLSLALLVSSANLSVAATTDTNVYTPPNYTTYRPPVKGGIFSDTVFGTAIKRISDSMNTTNVATGQPTIGISQEYATMSPFNNDTTRLLLIHRGYFALYDASGNFIKDLYQYGISSSSEPKWSRTDPNELYFISGTNLKKYNIGTNASTVVHAFSEYTNVSGMGESDISFDGRYLVLAGNKRYVFVYDLVTDTKGPIYDAGAAGLFDQLYITPDNNIIVGWYAKGSARMNGVELFDKNMVFQRQLAHAMGHMDVTRDTTGEEVMVWANGADSQLQVPCPAGITKVRLSDAKQTCVWTGDWSIAKHVSATDNNGWFFVDTYNPNDVIPPAGWVTYTDELLQVKLDGSEVRRLAHHRSRPLNGYTYQPKASVSRDGSKLVFTSNFGLQAQIGYPTEYTDAYLIELSGTASTETTTPTTSTPPTTPTTSTDTTGAVTRVEENNAAVTYTGTWSTNNNANHSGGSARGSSNAANRVTLSFSGTSVSFIMYKDQWAGIANISVDGVLHGEADTYASPSKAQANVYTVSGLSNGAHTVTVAPTGRKNASSGGLWLWVDAFDVSTSSTTSSTSTPTPTSPTSPTPTTPAPAPVLASYRTEQTSPAVTWTGAWSVNNNTVNSGGSAKLSNAAGAKATFTFTGTSVSWIGYRNALAGIAKVYVDGVVKGSVDTYASPGASQTIAYTISGLEYGTHTIIVEATGTKSSASRGSWVWVDAFDYVGTALTTSSQTIDSAAAINMVAGGQSLTSSGGMSLQVGSGLLEPVPGGQKAPSSLAIFGLKQNGVLVSEAGVPASVSVLRGRIFAETAGVVNTGLAVSNPNDTDATLSFFFTDGAGTNSAIGTLTIPAHGQIARFLDQSPFNVQRPASGTFTFNSNLPVSAIALRGLTNERSEFLVTTLPVADLDTPNPATMFFPHIADGGGWSTQLALLNPSDETISGTIRYLGELTNYSIAPRSSHKFGTTANQAQIRVGAAEVTPNGDIAPTGIAIFSYRNSGVTVSEAGVPSMSVGSAFRMYAEVNGNVRTGIAVRNNEETSIQATFQLNRLDGSPAGLTGTLEIPAAGQRSLFLNEIPGFESLTSPFQGILRVSSRTKADISVLGLRGYQNQRGDFLITTTPATDENASGQTQVFLPHIVNGSGYTTQLITFSGTTTEPASGSLRLFSETGGFSGFEFR
jgi:hypothetical protein